MTVTQTDGDTFSLKGKILIATPDMRDPRFVKSVIYICAHDTDHAMGLIINKAKGTLVVSDLLEQIGIDGDVRVADTPVLAGGPVDIDRGFVLHSPDYLSTSSLCLTATLRLTATKDILESFVSDNAPSRAMLAVGYAGWGGGQIERELQDNAWIVTEGTEALIFDTDMESKWTKALAQLGVTPEILSGSGGRA